MAVDPERLRRSGVELGKKMWSSMVPGLAKAKHGGPHERMEGAGTRDVVLPVPRRDRAKVPEEGDLRQPARKEIGRILRELCQQFEMEIVEGHAMADHVHLCLSIPPKHSVANALGQLKGKSAIRIHREYLVRARRFTGFHFWARGYCVSTVGLEEAQVREYIREQEEREKKEEHLALNWSPQKPD